tara:strand:+ start:41102 stop:42313 length:1212 start_codon:yes stop_codon:yes gene_type:complete
MASLDSFPDPRTGRSLRNVVIAGAGESDAIGTVPDQSGLMLAVSAAHNALADSGLEPGAVDGLFTARTSALTLAEYLGIRPRHLDNTWIGGNSFLTQMIHAAAALDAGLCRIALIVHGQAGRSAVRASLQDTEGLPHGNVVDSPDPNQPHLDYEVPHGIIGAPIQYGLAAARYMYEYGEERSRDAHFAIASAARNWAARTPRATLRKPLSRQEYDASPFIARPLRRADCCLVSDGGGAIVMVRRDDMPKGCHPVVMTGASEATSHAIISQMPDLTVTPAAHSAPAALAMAGRGLSQVDVVETYDAFTHSVLLGLEDIGYCGKGQGPDFIRDRAIGQEGGLAMNTNGGGLAYAHTGMYGAFLTVEGVRQLQGRATAQVADCKVALLNAYGGLLSSATTIILEQE